jgi:hypothetical protein
MRQFLSAQKLRCRILRHPSILLTVFAEENRADASFPGGKSIHLNELTRGDVLPNENVEKFRERLLTSRMAPTIMTTYQYVIINSRGPLRKSVDSVELSHLTSRLQVAVLKQFVSHPVPKRRETRRDAVFFLRIELVAAVFHANHSTIVNVDNSAQGKGGLESWNVPG